MTLTEFERYGSPDSTSPSQPAFPSTEIPLWSVGAAVIAIALIAVLALARARPKQPKRKLVRLF